LGITPLLLSLLVIPIATELPEKVNSILWIRKGKDTLAFGNITGALVFRELYCQQLALCLPLGATKRSSCRCRDYITWCSMVKVDDFSWTTPCLACLGEWLDVYRILGTCSKLRANVLLLNLPVSFKPIY